MKKLNQLRVEAGYSIVDLARLMQVDEMVACDWLCGRAEPTPEQRSHLALLLWVDPRELDDVPHEPTPRAERLRRRVSAVGARFQQ